MDERLRDVTLSYRCGCVCVRELWRRENGGRDGRKDERGIIRPTPGRGAWQVKGRVEGKRWKKTDRFGGVGGEGGSKARTR